MNDVKNGILSQKIIDSFVNHHFPVNESEVRSWDESMWRMYGVLNDNDIPKDVNVAIEYQIPLTAKRVDFMIAGMDSKNQENVVIIELKQWEEVTPTSRDGIVMTYVGGDNRAVVHPSYQAYSYAKTIENFNATVQAERISLRPCAYLHNFERKNIDKIVNESYSEFTNEAPVFIKDEATKLSDFIKKYISKKDAKGDLLYRIDQGKIKPSKALQDALANMLNDREEFVLLDEQKVAYETVLKTVINYNKNKQKSVVIIEGGPGTGKSVIAINLLAKLTTKGMLVHFVSKNAAPRNVYFDILKGNNFKMNYMKNLFKYSGSFVDVVTNTYDCLLVDEAHRLAGKSSMGTYMIGENQIKELISASKTTVFFIDEDQKVTAQDIGSIAEIVKWANHFNANVIYNNDTKLLSQFRCNGSNGYLAWVDQLLQIRKDIISSDFLKEYEVVIFDDPAEMREALRIKNSNNKARMLAGYCWEWVSQKNPKDEIYDIVIDPNFKHKWNFAIAKPFAIDKESFEQVGCIHTSQGLEFEYVGVIIGPDLTLENGKVCAHQERRAKTDYSLKGLKNRPDLADVLIKNTYKTLLTRAQKGCYIYCTDSSLREYLKESLQKLTI